MTLEIVLQLLSLQGYRMRVLASSQGLQVIDGVTITAAERAALEAANAAAEPEPSPPAAAPAPVLRTSSPAPILRQPAGGPHTDLQSVLLIGVCKDLLSLQLPRDIVRYDLSLSCDHSAALHSLGFTRSLLPSHAFAITPST